MLGIVCVNLIDFLSLDSFGKEYKGKPPNHVFTEILLYSEKGCLTYLFTEN